MTKLSGRAAIVGSGDSYADRENRKIPLQRAAEALRTALKDCGLRKDDVGALLPGSQ